MCRYDYLNFSCLFAYSILLPAVEPKSSTGVLPQKVAQFLSSLLRFHGPWSASLLRKLHFDSRETFSLPCCTIWQLFKSKLTLSKIDQKINISTQMGKQEAIQVLDYYHPTRNLAGILDQQNYSHRDCLSHRSMDILHEQRITNSSVQFYNGQSNCCKHFIKSFQKIYFPTTSVTLKPLSQR